MRIVQIEIVVQGMKNVLELNPETISYLTRNGDDHWYVILTNGMSFTIDDKTKADMEYLWATKN